MKPLPRFGLRAELIVSYLAIGLVITASCLFATRSLELRMSRAQAARSETARAAFELTAVINGAFEDGFGYIAAREESEKASYQRRMGEAREQQQRLARRSDLRADESAEIDRVGVTLERVIAEVNTMFDDVERRGRVSSASYAVYDASMDELADSASSAARLIAARVESDAADTRAFGDRALLAVGVGAIAIALVVGHLFARRIIRPVRSLRDAARAFGSGGDMPDVDIVAAREIAELDRAFRAMASDVRSGLASIADHRQRLDDIFSSIDEMLIVVDCAGVVTAVNRATCTKLGLSEGELVGRPLERLFTTIGFDEVWSRVTSGGTFDFRAISFGDAAMRAGSGDRVPVSLSAALMLSDENVRGVVCVAQDLSEQKRIEAELRQAQKLEAIGILSAGIAHEINNPMQYINDSITFVGEATETLVALLRRYRAAANTRFPERLLADARRYENEIDAQFLEAGLPDAIASALEGVQRITTIVRSMKAVSHPSRDEMGAVDLAQAIRGALTISRNAYKYVAEVETDLADLPPIRGHAGELGQVLLNILLNATHAIEDKVKGAGEMGKLVVKMRDAGDDVIITVADTGNGIPEKARAKIFDPFFTTKDVGRGTGQGLAIARAIVESHGGVITFESAEGKGTTFYVRLPKGGPTRASRRPASFHPVRANRIGYSTVP